MSDKIDKARSPLLSKEDHTADPAEQAKRVLIKLGLKYPPDAELLIKDAAQVAWLLKLVDYIETYDTNPSSEVRPSHVISDFYTLYCERKMRIVDQGKRHAIQRNLFLQLEKVMIVRMEQYKPNEKLMREIPEEERKELFQKCKRELENIERALELCAFVIRSEGVRMDESIVTRGRKES